MELHELLSDNTLLFLYKPETRKILLAMTKRGFGKGKWNGIGGKVEERETIEAAAVRETKEETGVDIDPEDLEKRGVIHFTFEGKPELERDVHIFFAEDWKGNPVETEEMRPQWFPTDELPYGEMWVADEQWLPKALAGEIIAARFHLSTDGKSILRMEMK